jgi:hypothetical protein
VRVSPWFRYSLIRLGLFAGTFSLLLVLGIVWWASALFATVISFTVSYIFFAKLRSEVAEDLATRVRNSKKIDDDSAIEDDQIDSEGNRER